LLYTAGALSVLVAGIGAFKIALGAVTLVWAILGKTLLLNPIYLAGVAIVGAAYLIYKNWGEIKSFFSATFEAIATNFKKAQAWCDEFFAPLTALSDALRDWAYNKIAAVFDWLSDKFTAWLAEFKQNLQEAKNLISSVTDAWSKPKETLKSLASTNGDDLKNMWDYFAENNLGISRTPAPVIATTSGLKGAVKNNNKTTNLTAAPVVNVTLNGTLPHNAAQTADLIGSKVGQALAHTRFNASLRDID